MVPRGDVLCSLLLVLALGAGSVSAAEPTTPVAATDSPTLDQLWVANETLTGPAWQVGLPSNTTTRSNTSWMGLDVGAAIVHQHARIETRLFDASLRSRYEAASTDDERFEVLAEASDRTARRLSVLDEAEERATREFATGEISTGTFIDRLTRIQLEARTLRDTVGWLEAAGAEIESAEIVRRSGVLRARIAVLSWPVQDRIEATRVGTAPSIQVYVTASPQGFVVSSIVDGEFVRQVRRYDQRASSGPTNDIRTSLDEIYATYPTAVSSVNAISVGGERSAGVFYATIETQRGITITSYIDNRNLQVFEEIYRQPLSSIRAGGGVQTSGDGLTMVISRTLAGGPMRVEVLDRESGEPVDARVTVDGRVVGSTGSTGRLWLVDTGEPAAVNATAADGGSVSFTVDRIGTNETA